MRRSFLFLLIFLVPVPAFAQAPAGEAGVRRSAWEQIPPGFIGNWKLDTAASKYASAAPRMQYRIIDYTADGKFICTYITLGARNSDSPAAPGLPPKVLLAAVRASTQ